MAEPTREQIIEHAVGEYIDQRRVYQSSHTEALRFAIGVALEIQAKGDMPLTLSQMIAAAIAKLDHQGSEKQ